VVDLDLSSVNPNGGSAGDICIIVPYILPSVIVMWPTSTVVQPTQTAVLLALTGINHEVLQAAESNYILVDRDRSLAHPNCSSTGTKHAVVHYTKLSCILTDID